MSFWGHTMTSSKSQVLLVALVMFSLLGPLDKAAAQDNAWRSSTSSIVVMEVAQNSPTVTPASRIAASRGCNAGESVALSMTVNRGGDWITFSRSVACAPTLVGTTIFGFDRFSKKDPFNYTTATLTRGDEKFLLLDGEIIIELTSGKTPANYHVSFEMRFATKEHQERFLEGKLIEKEHIIEVSGMLMIEPDVMCRSRQSRYHYDYDRVSAPLPPRKGGDFCYRLLGLPNPKDGKAPMPRRRDEN